MLSMKERDFFERIAIPHILFSNKDGNIKAELVSDRLCCIVGIDRDSILNNTMGLIHPDDVECLSVSFRRFIEDHSSLDVMIRVFDKNINSYKLMHGEGLWQLLEDGSEMILFYFDNSRTIQSGIRHIYSCLSEKIQIKITMTL